MARQRRLQLVIDTMVVIRGARAFRQQPPAPTTPELRLLLGWVDDVHLFDWLYSPPILDEYRAILRRLKVPAHAVGRFLNLLRVAGIAVETHDLGPFSPVRWAASSTSCGQQASRLRRIISARSHLTRRTIRSITVRS